MLEAQLQRACGCSADAARAAAATAAPHIAQLLRAGGAAASPRAESLRFMGFSVLQFAAALHAYSAHIGGGQRPQLPLPLLRWERFPVVCAAGAQQQHGAAAAQAEVLPGWQDCLAAAAAAAAAGNSAPSGGGAQQGMARVSKQAAQLTTLRHRAKMWLGLLQGDGEYGGADADADSSWCPAASAMRSCGWKRQKQGMAHCLDMLLAGVYLAPPPGGRDSSVGGGRGCGDHDDSGLEAATRVAAMLLAATPPTTHDKSWMPSWTRPNNGSGGGAAQGA
jgi:hypothetical protein